MRDLIVRRICAQCRKVVEIMVDGQDFKAWKDGELIQKAMPYLSANEREILISGICGGCFDALTSCRGISS